MWVAVLLSLQEVPLDDVLERTGLWIEVDPLTGMREVAGIRFAVGAAEAVVDGRPLELPSPVRVRRGTVLIPRTLAGILEERAVARPAGKEAVRPDPPPKIGFRVCLDPGHGGSYRGAVSATRGVAEKTLTLDVALRAARILREMGMEAVLTRMTDAHLSSKLYDDLERRLSVARASRCDAFVSLHFNWVSDPAIRGFEIYVPRSGAHAAASRALGERLRESLRKAGVSADRGIRDSGFYVLRNADVPAVLAELEYISNPEGERAALDPAVREKLARAVAEAIRAYAVSRDR